MKRNVAMGLAGGVAVAMAASRLARSRHRISFDGRVVVITGGSRGLGLVMARLLVDEGAHVVLLARDLGELERAVEDLQSRGRGGVTALRCDIRRRADVRAAVDTILDRRRTVDILVNNAGVIQVGPIEHMMEDDFENAIHRRFGRIVNVSSIGGRIAVPHLGPYCASKFALVGLSDAARAELDRYSIRVTTVAPGLIRTGSPMNAQFKGQHGAEYAWFKVSSSIPGVTIAAERAARRIVEACRYGDPSLTITPQAKLAAVANAVAPNTVARAMMVVSRLLPSATGPSGNQSLKGRQTDPGTRWTPSIVTLTDKAALANNEL